MHETLAPASGAFNLIVAPEAAAADLVQIVAGQGVALLLGQGQDLLGRGAGIELGPQTRRPKQPEKAERLQRVVSKRADANLVLKGYAFEYWKGSKYYPGDKYSVKGNHSFTAVWSQATPSSVPGQSSPNVDSKANDKGGTSDSKPGTASTTGAAARTNTPRTGDASTTLVPVLLMATCTLFAAWAWRRQ